VCSGFGENGLEVALDGVFGYLQLPGDFLDAASRRQQCGDSRLRPRETVDFEQDLLAREELAFRIIEKQGNGLTVIPGSSLTIAAEPRDRLWTD